MRCLALCALLLSPAALRAQAADHCHDLPVYYAFQTDSQARWIPDTTLVARPDPAARGGANIVQFVVDSAGVPRLNTFKALKNNDPLLIADVRRQLPTWRYTPPVVDGCHVAQLVQTAVRR